MKISIQRNPRSLPAHIRGAFSNPPRAGSGVHKWLFITALRCHKYMAQDEIIRRLTAAVQGCGREVPHAEIVAAVVNSASKKGRRQFKVRGVPAPGGHAKKWPAVNSALQAKVISDYPCTVRQFRGMSPYEIDTDYNDAYWFVTSLFPDYPPLCIGSDLNRASTGPIEQFEEKLDRMTFIVPSAMTSKFGLTLNGERSQRTLTNTGPRRYLVTEFDSLTLDEQVSMILHLRPYASLALVLWSGGKSLHAWWSCYDTSNSQQKEFFSYAVRLGADPHTWTKCQLVRLPQGWRADKRTRQSVYYFDPACVHAGEKGGAQ